MGAGDPALERLFSAARQGSGQALGDILETFRGYLLAIAEREMTPDLRAKGGASDLVQETFLKAQGQFGDFRGSSEAELKGWLRQILRNHLTDFDRHYRQSAKRRVGREVKLAAEDSTAPPGDVLAADTPSPSGQAMAQELAQRTAAALARLPEDYRQVIEYRYQDQRSFEEIGRLLNLTPNAARKLWARAVKKLQEEMDKPP